MKLPFLDRQKELKRIGKALASPEAQCVILYGRRRCGKSRLIRHILKERDIYFLADQSDKRLQIKALSGEIGKVVHGFSSVEYPDWRSLFDNLDRFAGERVTLFIDEFPYLVQNSPELPSILQRFLDLPKINRIDIVLCGSSQRMMYGFALKATSPLYGRAQQIIHIEPLKAGWISEALGKNPEESVGTYAVFGGVPRYWELAKNYEDTDTAIKELILDKNGILHNEPVRLLLDDMRSTTQPYSLLYLIGNGCHRLSEIAGRLMKPAGHLSRTLSYLIDLGYIKRELPFGENIKSTKKTLYKLSDPFLRFYFKYIQPYKSMLEMDMIEPVFSKIQKDINHHIGGVWEDIARDSVPRLDIGGIEWNVAARWWGKAPDKNPIEIDIVAESLDNKSLLIGEVKWADSPDIASIETSLEQKARYLAGDNKKDIVYAVWTKKAVSGNGKVHQITPKTVLERVR
ncbi:MAG: ATP-binding protein [Spirochaetales bacterium]|nr:ATP-binding protein [Spirochaetales bacterium]